MRFLTGFAIVISISSVISINISYRIANEVQQNFDKVNDAFERLLTDYP